MFRALGVGMREREREGVERERVDRETEDREKERETERD